MSSTAKFYSNLQRARSLTTAESLAEVMQIAAESLDKNESVTPRKTGALRRNVVVTKTMNQVLIIYKQSPYAAVQDLGYRTSKHGMVYMRKYTTPGTGKGFSGKLVKRIVSSLNGR